ncbi:hypothetical protein KDN32_19095 [Nocardioides sp. J2M5]|uniref:hypothetical protein n=1 Tax=Nocardioides palaemonis TaxID=2829810 RepID=UPI001BA6B5FB|nr:hypothetical protein [Nocardioides palaemonis]MBS2939852.1 hypothetical protein [Nocardioides palaemonis]
MQLHAVVAVPEDAIRATVLDVVPSLVAASAPPVPEEAGRGLLGRWRRRPEAPPAPLVSFVPAAPESVFVKIAKFGNVTADVAGELAAELEEAAAGWHAPVLRVSKVVVSEAAPHTVTAELEGDVDALREIYRNVLEVAALHRFYLDRRNFRPEIVLGRLEAPEGAAVPEVLAGLEVDRSGPWWSADHLSLLRVSFSGGTGFAEYAQIALVDDAGGAEIYHLA